MVLEVICGEEGTVDITFCSEHDDIDAALLKCDDNHITREEDQGNYLVDTTTGDNFGGIDSGGVRSDYKYQLEQGYIS